MIDPSPGHSQSAPRWRTLGQLGLAAGMAVVIYAANWLRPVPHAEVPRATVSGIDPQLAATFLLAREQVEASPESGEAWGRYGMLLLQHDRPREALACFEQASRLDAGTARWPYYAGRLCEQTNYETARGWYERALRRDPRYVPLRLHLALLLSRQGLTDEATRQLNELLQLAPGTTAAYVELSRLARLQGNAADATGVLDRARERGFSTRELELERGAVAALEGRTDEARAALQRADRLPPTAEPPDPWLGDVRSLDASGAISSAQADALRQQGQLSQAEAALIELAQQHPERSRPQLNHAMLWLEQGRLDESLQELNRLAERFPDDPLILFGRARAELALHQIPAAEADLRETLRRKPDLAEAQVHLGELLEKSGRPQEALSAYQQALAAAPEQPAPYLAVARLLIELERADDARDVLRRAGQLGVDDAAFTAELERLDALAGNSRGAE